jgi:hypothetical protein
MTRPTPEEHVLQKARVWRRTERALTGARGSEKAAAATAHTVAKRKLREAVDILEQKDGAR